MAGTHPDNLYTQSFSGGFVTTTREQRAQIDGVDLIHRRRETVPSPGGATFDRRQLDPNNGVPSTGPWLHRVQTGFNQARTGLTGLAQGIVSCVSNLSTGRGGGHGSFVSARRERWTLKVSASYQNEENSIVEDLMELQFDSKAAAEEYWERWRRDREASGSIIPCTVHIFQDHAPPK